MGVAKVTLNDTTLIDVTQKTVDAASMLASKTALNKAGNDITGTIASKSSTDLTASGKTVTVQAGYYASQATKDVDTMTLPTAATSSAASGSTLKATIGRSTSDQYINIPTGYNTAKGHYKVSAVANMTLPTSASSTSSGTSKATIGRSASNQYINIPTGYNSAAAYYTVSAVANGTAGTPTATKGTVSNNSVSVTPSVTNTTGYITGSTKTGTAVTVSASELVSGTKSITENGTGIDVTNYASVDVAVPSSTPDEYGLIPAYLTINDNSSGKLKSTAPIWIWYSLTNATSLNNLYYSSRTFTAASSRRQIKLPTFGGNKGILHAVTSTVTANSNVGIQLDSSSTGCTTAVLGTRYLCLMCDENAEIVLNATNDS